MGRFDQSVTNSGTFWLGDVLTRGIRQNSDVSVTSVTLTLVVIRGLPNVTRGRFDLHPLR